MNATTEETLEFLRRRVKSLEDELAIYKGHYDKPVEETSDYSTGLPPVVYTPHVENIIVTHVPEGILSPPVVENSDEGKPWTAEEIDDVNMSLALDWAEFMNEWIRQFCISWDVDMGMTPPMCYPEAICEAVKRIEIKAYEKSIDVCKNTITFTDSARGALESTEIRIRTLLIDPNIHAIEQPNSSL